MLLALPPTALGDPGVVGPFEGVWIGDSVVVERQRRGPAVTASDISVTIRASDSGFEMTWKALQQQGAGWLTARFIAAEEPGTFVLAGVEPPLPDNDTVWAEIDGDQLVVYLVSAGANPAESVSRYRRTVPDNRMTFGYTVTRGGEIVDSVTGTLIKAKVVL